jgi:hypothetical protein
MPWKSEWVPAEVFLELNGVKVYHTYKDDELSNGPWHDWFSLYDSGQDEGEEHKWGKFDIRELSTYGPDKSREDVLKEAIEFGILKLPSTSEALKAISSLTGRDENQFVLAEDFGDEGLIFVSSEGSRYYVEPEIERQFSPNTPEMIARVKVLGTYEGLVVYREEGEIPGE